MVERIREILQVNQLTPTQFADSIGVARPIISHILSGRNKPSLEVVQKILAAFPQLSLDWLLKGTGSMLAGVPVAAAISGVAAQRAAPAAPPIDVPVEASSSPPSAQRAAKAPRYRPQPAPPAPDLHGSGRTPAGPVAYPILAPAPVTSDVALAAEGPVASAVLPITQSTAPAATVDAGAVATVVPPPATSSSPSTEAVATKSVESAPAQPADMPLVSAFAEPGKVIRRIVIFYQDGTFTDYQPELRLT